MAGHTSRESYLELPIRAPNDIQSQYSADGPASWANLVVESAIQSGVESKSDLLERLRVGKIAIGVVYAHEDWVEAAESGLLLQPIGGSVVASGNVLQVTQTNTRVSWVEFRRTEVGAPYMPKRLEGIVEVLKPSPQPPEDCLVR